MGSTITREQYFVLVLRNLGIPHPMYHRHLGALNGCVVWTHAETGEHPGLCNGLPFQGARNNPLNTTLVMPGSTPYNHITDTIGVQNYTSPQSGALAVAHTLLNTPDRGYEDIVAELRQRSVKVEDVLAAIARSQWGTPGSTLFASLGAFRFHGMQNFYRDYPVGP